MKPMLLWLAKKERYNWLVYGGLALLILLPLLAPGFVLTLDMVFTPHPTLPTYVGSSYVFHALVYGASNILPADVVQKVILFGILLLSGMGAHRLVQWLNPKQNGQNWRVAAYFAGMLYTVNPFVYDRFMAGQYAVLLGYALLPFLVRAMFILADKPVWRTSLPVAAWVTAISIVSIHTLGAVVVMMWATLAVAIWRKRRQPTLAKKIIVWFGLALGVFVVASSYWLVPLLLGQGPTALQIQHFDDVDRKAFATSGGNTIGAISNVVRLQGFWVETTGQFVLPAQTVGLWGLLGLVFIGLTVIGLVWAWQKQRFVAVIFGFSILAGIWLAVGGVSFLAQSVPLLAGLREPQKMAMLIALGYSVMGAYGVAVVLAKMYRGVILAAVAVIILPIIWTPTMLWGFNGQLRAANYPHDWYMAKQILSSSPQKGKTLFLPWHQYLKLGFAGRIVANPAEAFFGSKVIASHDPEYANLGPDQAFTESFDVQTKILGYDKQASFAEHLLKANINYVLLINEFDYSDYSYLNSQPGLQTIYRGKDLTLYQVMPAKGAA
jgi:hypothetical protein